MDESPYQKLGADQEALMELEKEKDSPPAYSKSRDTPRDSKPMEMNEFVEIAGFGWFQIIHVCLLGVIYLGDAAEMSLNSVILSDLTCEWALTPFQQGLIPFTTLGVQCIGSIIGGILADKYGRRLLLIINLWLLLLFSVLSTLATTFYWYLCLRGLVGLCVGSNSAAGVTYAFEIVPTSCRALTMFILDCWWIAGSAYEYWVGYFIMNTFGWKAQVLLSALPALVAAISVPFIRKSPRFCYITGDVEEAEHAISRMFNWNNKPLPENKLFVQIETKRGRLQDAFSPQYLRTTLVLMQVFFVNMFIGYGQGYLIVDVFTFGYCEDASSSITNSTLSAVMAGSSEISCVLSKSDYLYMSFVNILGVPACLIGYYLSDKIGRVTSMIVSAILITAILIPMLFCFGLELLLVEITIFIFVNMFQNMALWTYMPEVYPTYVRNAAVGFINGQGKIGAALGAFSTQVVSNYSVRTILFVYLALSIFQMCCVCLFNVETKDVKLQDERTDNEYLSLKRDKEDPLPLLQG